MANKTDIHNRWGGFIKIISLCYPLSTLHERCILTDSFLLPCVSLRFLAFALLVFPLPSGEGSGERV